MAWIIEHMCYLAKGLDISPILKSRPGSVKDSIINLGFPPGESSPNKQSAFLPLSGLNGQARARFKQTLTQKKGPFAGEG
jgi:hypothetical protein